jgi:hypothetical protein
MIAGKCVYCGEVVNEGDLDAVHVCGDSFAHEQCLLEYDDDATETGENVETARTRVAEELRA